MDPAIAPRHDGPPPPPVSGPAPTPAPVPAPAAEPGTAAAPDSPVHHGPAPDRPGSGIRGAERRTRALGLAAAAGATAYVGLVDPSEGGAYPLCPSQVVLGVDCPACGGLRGTHDLLNGDVAGALDHNLLLPALLATFAFAFALWLRPLFGRPTRPLRLPRWLVAGGIVVATTFAVLRNLPIDGLEFLASGS